MAFLIISCSTKKENKEKSQDKKSNTEQQEKKSEKKQMDKGKGILSSYDISNTSPAIVELTSSLDEISGIAFTSDNRLFAHGDELGDIYELDPEFGKVIKMFSLGEIKVIKGDFEDIAIGKEKFYLLDSKGKIFEFTEGVSGSFVDFTTHKTTLSAKYDVEGLCYDPDNGSLLLACKEFGGDEYAKDKVVYSFSLANSTMDEKPRFVIPVKNVKDNSEENKFSPSGISRNPVSGSFFMIAAKGNVIIEISKDGEILGQAHLPDDIHRQAEGIAFKSDGTLYISNEAKGKRPVLVIYPLNK